MATTSEIRANWYIYEAVMKEKQMQYARPPCMLPVLRLDDRNCVLTPGDATLWYRPLTGLLHPQRVYTLINMHLPWREVNSGRYFASCQRFRDGLYKEIGQVPAQIAALTQFCDPDSSSIVASFLRPDLLSFSYLIEQI